MARNIKYVAVHCTAGNQKNTTIEGLKKEWQKLGWKAPGYHYVVMPDGEIIKLLHEEKISNGVAGYNSSLINVAYVGGIDSKGKAIDNRTQEQKASMCYLLEEIKERRPKILIQGHRDFSPDKNKNGVIEPIEWVKQCPCFDAKKEYANL